MKADLPKEMAFDVRIIERNLRKGIITKKDLEKHLKELPDRAEAVAVVEAKLEQRGKVAAARARREEEEEID